MVKNDVLIRLQAADKRGRVDPRLEKLIALPGTKSPSRHSWEHETLCADCFIELFLKNILTGWSERWDKAELQAFGRKFLKVFDRRFTTTLSKQTKILDVLTGTESFEQLRGKANRLVKLANEVDENFSVIWVVSPLARDNMDAYLNNILQEVILPLNRGSQFTVANLDEFCDDPAGPVLRTTRTLTDPSSRLSLAH